MAKAKLAAAAAQEVLIEGKTSGTAEIKVSSAALPSVSTSVTVNVLDADVSTSSVGSIEVGQNKLITVGLEKDLLGREAEVAVAFKITSSDNQDVFVTIAPVQGNKFAANLLGMIANSGGRVGAEVSIGDIIYKDDSRVSVIPAAAPKEVTKLEAIPK